MLLILITFPSNSSQLWYPNVKTNTHTRHSQKHLTSRLALPIQPKNSFCIRIKLDFISDSYFWHRIQSFKIKSKITRFIFLEHANSRKIEILESHNIHVLSKHHPSIPYQCTCNVVQSLSIYSHFIKPLATSTFLYTLFSFYAFSDRHLIIIFYIPCCVWQYSIWHWARNCL